MKLSDNFTLKECLEGTAMPKEAIKMAYDALTPEIQNNLKTVCEAVQEARKAMNNKFKYRNGGKEIGFTVTAGFRAKAWDIKQGRSGAGTHPMGLALDVQPNVKDDDLYCEIFDYLYKLYFDREIGWNGGFAAKMYEKGRTGKLIKKGFLHFDKRKAIARWLY
jgi:hypothetical protein